VFCSYVYFFDVKLISFIQFNIIFPAEQIRLEVCPDFGVHFLFTSSGGEEGTRYSFWLHTKRMTKVTIEWEDGFREEFFPHELAILPVKKYSDEELVEIEKAKKKAKKKK